jgi:hypothetical protein
MTRARILADYVSSGDELALKAPLAGPTFTGTVAIPNVANLETAVVANTAKVTNANPTLADINALDITELGTVTSGSIAGGSITSATTFPAGHIIKATSNFYNSAESDSFGNTYATVTASGSNHWSHSITDVAASSWVWIVTTFTLRVESTANAGGAGVKLNRNLNTDLFPVVTYDLYQWHMPATSGQTGSGISAPVTISWMDKTPITGTNTYYLKAADYVSTTNAYIYSSSTSRPFSMELFEIAQ